jgi:hypothetical protein
MKRAILFLSLFAGISFALCAQEASLSLATNATASNLGSFDAYIYELATPSFTLPLGSSAEIAGSGYVMPSYDFVARNAPFCYGLEKLRYEHALKNPGEGMSAFVFDAGRFDFSDPSGYILTSPADGFSFQFKYPAIEVAFRSAYTGLLFLKGSTTVSPVIAMSLADKARISDGTDLTGSPRFIAQVDLSLPKFFGQAIDFSCISQNDLNPDSSLVSAGTSTYQSGMGGRVNTQYFELKSSGSIVVVDYDAFFAYGSGTTLTWLTGSSGSSYQYCPISSYLAGLKASLPLNDLPAPLALSSAALSLLYASGDRNASSAIEGNTSSIYAAFTPITSPTLGAVFSPSISNLLLGELSFTTSPTIGNYTVNSSAKLLSFFRPTTGPISEDGIDSTSISPYLGTEMDISLSTGLFSDFGLSFVGGAFLPGDAFAPSYKSVQFSAALTATITM